MGSPCLVASIETRGSSAPRAATGRTKDAAMKTSAPGAFARKGNERAMVTSARIVPEMGQPGWSVFAFPPVGSITERSRPHTSGGPVGVRAGRARSTLVAEGTVRAGRERMRFHVLGVLALAFTVGGCGGSAPAGPDPTNAMTINSIL